MSKIGKEIVFYKLLTQVSLKHHMHRVVQSKLPLFQLHTEGVCYDESIVLYLLK
jgi:hypothetical protein